MAIGNPPSPPPDERPDALTIGDVIGYLLPRVRQGDPGVPRWPPDVFAVAAYVLHKSGAYCEVLEHWPPAAGDLPDPIAQWSERIGGIGKAWRLAWASGKSPPDEVAHWWEKLLGACQRYLSDLRADKDLRECLAELMAAADAASVGLGIPSGEITVEGAGGPTSEPDATEAAFQNQGDDLLFVDPDDPNPVGSTLCDEIHRSRLRVLPKLHTPQSGLTIRSFSHHLAMVDCNEVVPEWYLIPTSQSELSMNLLLVPWPEVVQPKHFYPSKPMPEEKMPPEFHYFTYKGADDAAGDEALHQRVSAVYRAAKEAMERVDAVILPELALTPPQHEKLRVEMERERVMLICGEGTASEPGVRPGDNGACVDVPVAGKSVPLRQGKHHRWRLDKPQIIQYGLGSRLYPEWFWWEHVALQRRFMFLAMRPWLVMSVLICEDLARPDPVGDLLRAVGPNLVVALLMDGPQLKERWSARYATVLADDPGCSVLSLTSIGMAELSRPPSVSPRTRVVALWKDSQSGAVEIELPAGHQGIVLTLTVKYMTEWSADGRSDRGTTGCPILAGVRPIPSP